jgi:hypothetical protein
VVVLAVERVDSVNTRLSSGGRFASLTQSMPFDGVRHYVAAVVGTKRKTVVASKQGKVAATSSGHQDESAAHG